MDSQGGYSGGIYGASANPIGSLCFNVWTWLVKALLELEMPEMPDDEEAMGNQARWRVIFLEKQSELKKSMTYALLDDTMPQWFERHVRKVVEKDDWPEHLVGLGPRNAYMLEIIRRNFQGIPWAVRCSNRELIRRLST
jgi:hypothetical protein